MKIFVSFWQFALGSEPEVMNIDDEHLLDNHREAPMGDSGQRLSIGVRDSGVTRQFCRHAATCGSIHGQLRG